MRQDATTLKDLSIFTSGGSIFSLLDYTRTLKGKEALRQMLLSPPGDHPSLQAVQDAVRFFSVHPETLPDQITNGTIVMLEQFFEGADYQTAPPSGAVLSLQVFLDRLFNKNAYSFNKFSLSHLSDFLNGCIKLCSLQTQEDLPFLLAGRVKEIQDILAANSLVPAIVSLTQEAGYKSLVRLSYRARRELKQAVYRLMKIYAQLDAWSALGRAAVAHQWVFPVLHPPFPVHLEAKGLYHPLLKKPVSYDISFDGKSNFLLLTGANMSGKTTFIRAAGVAAFLAHIGSAVPAASFSGSFLSGIVTNMHVEDNIQAGESYFLAEVRRMKRTAEKINEAAPHLVLMDELFKGTNVHDAYECTRAVTEGLLNHQQHVMILSTHLYEVARKFQERKDIRFACFVTDVDAEGRFSFTYSLKEGISEDRIGFRILEQEGVLSLLQPASGRK